MVSVPGFLLRRLYVKQSLRNTPEGFQFEIKNSLGSGYAHRLMPLTVDGSEVPISQAFFILDGSQTAFVDVSKENTFTLAMNKSITIRAHNVTLDAGLRKIGMGFEVPGLGSLKFDFTDVVTDERD